MTSFASQPAALVKPPEKTVIQGGFSGDTGYQHTLTIGMLAPLFLEWLRYEMRRAPATVQRYGEALQWVIRDIGDQPVTGLHLGHLLTLRRKMETRGCREARMAAILHGLRAFLKFCREVVRVPTLSSREIRVPRIPRRDVIYLTREEVQRYVDAIIAPGDAWEDVPLSRLRFRALVEVLLGTGARISEVLSLNRSDIHRERKEAKIIGKGNKERMLYFTDRALLWLERYLSRRWDDDEALFVTQGDPPRRLRQQDRIKDTFALYRRRADLTKPVSPHILRHTMATTLLFNGCPIGHIKELLGHERLDTTCRYYLGLDRRAARAAHGQFLSYE
jgi:site-specific recombinase XerD